MTLLSYTYQLDGRVLRIYSYYRYQIQYTMPYLAYFTKKKKNSHKFVKFGNSQVNFRIVWVSKEWSSYSIG